MNTEAVITFNLDGTATALWTEAVPLAELGRLKMKRASTVEFNARLQEWEVRWSGSRRVVFQHPSREACLRWERRQLSK